MGHTSTSELNENCEATLAGKARGQRPKAKTPKTVIQSEGRGAQAESKRDREREREKTTYRFKREREREI